MPCLITWIENPENRSWVEEIVKKHADEANRFEKKLKKIEEQEAQRVIVVAYDESIHKDRYQREFNIHSKFSNHLTMLLKEAKKTV